MKAGKWKNLLAVLLLAQLAFSPTASAGFAEDVLKIAGADALVKVLEPLFQGGGETKEEKEQQEKEQQEKADNKQEKKMDKALVKPAREDAMTQVMAWAEAGDPQAQCILSYAYLTGQRVKKDRKLALMWQERAAEQNSELVKHFIAESDYGKRRLKLPHLFALAGRRAHLGRYVPKDYKAAVRWSLLGAREKDKDACAYLGAAYYTGRGIGQDYQKAIEYLRQSDRDNPLTLRIFYMAYRDGNGVEKNPELAKKCLDYMRLVIEKKEAKQKERQARKYQKKIEEGEFYGIVR